MNKYVVIKVGNEEYGLSIDYVTNIEKYKSVTPIPHAPSYMLGMVDIREEVIPVLDAKQILFEQKTLHSGERFLIILKIDNKSLSLLVEEAKNILDVTDDMIKPFVSVSNQSSFLKGIVNVDEKLITLIDFRDVLQSLDNLPDIQKVLEKRTSMQ
ncbi:purine-binding chemotaxis protein CheW [Bacillus sp. HMF5848]|uniref:chemotaxis protein CheW n=1 Tax=Bacillus sp. HMF5848 TaxID=2495421 RepID=UPI000F797624|nr:chemotaxis protein CheW [Bacillus sp. HMF5848]RSK27661.1 purine-binding chemotaxis protein CheW [Bacillus sp. HMF5848]